jgi:hypothetical protein
MLHLQEPRPGIGHNVNVAPSVDDERASREGAVDYDDGLLAVAGPIMMLAYAGALGVAAFTFVGSGEALLPVVISMGFAMMYFVVPLLMHRVRAARDQRWQRDTAQRTSATVDLWTGPIHRWEGVAQIIIVPIAVLCGFASFALIWILNA